MYHQVFMVRARSLLADLTKAQNSLSLGVGVSSNFEELCFSATESFSWFLNVKWVYHWPGPSFSVFLQVALRWR